ncbi:MAG: class I SAM-dependent methyltransferase [Candidatus Kapabacteria bacterium]|nr:class I SAM-dependent methyltransferase [Candidatus Kapabacteria bacterium]
MNSVQPYSPLEFAQMCVHRHITPDAVCVDATCGNGHDTMFLLSNIGGKGCVIGFDIQQQAIERTQRLCSSRPNYARLTLIHGSHDDIQNHLAARGIHSFRILMMNCGYLPHAEKSITTTAHTTEAMLLQAVSMLEHGGCITVVVYRGHEGASEEADAVIAFASMLSKKDFTCARYQPLGGAAAPECVVIARREE